MNTVRDVCKYIGKVIVDLPTCVETGCTYVLARSEDIIHTTTNNIIDYICRPKEGYLYSLDVEPIHINFASNLVGANAPVEFVLGDSVQSLKELHTQLSIDGIDVLCLDSKEFDEYHMVNEFLAVQNCLNEKHFILVDDIHNPNSVKYKKMTPILKELGYGWMEVSTPTGLFLASKGYSLPK